MEGIYLAAFLEELRRRLPAEVLAWAFPAPGEAVLALAGGLDELAIVYRPAEARLEWRPPRTTRPAGRSERGRLASAVAQQARGSLERADQVRLDRVVILTFSGVRGFVDEPPRRLVLEAIGHRAALLLLDESGRVLHGSGPGEGRRRGRPYQSPAAQSKLDPRFAERELIDQALRLRQAGDAAPGSVSAALIAVLDGVGPVAAGRISREAGLDPEAPLKTISGTEVTRLAMTAKLVAANPGRWLPPARPDRRREPGEELRARALVEAERRLRSARARLGDARRTIERGAAANELKTRADELMLEAADRGRDAVAEAQAHYQRYKRRREQAAHARSNLADREAAATEAAGLVERLRTAPVEKIREIASGLIRAAEHRTRKRIGRAFELGGFEVLVGRAAAENERLTFELAAPRDLWLHARDHSGSHVILRSGGRPVPRETLEAAAGIAAYYSKARGHTTAEVHVARVADVRRVRGTARGLVRVNRSETLIVRPALPGTDSAV